MFTEIEKTTEEAFLRKSLFNEQNWLSVVGFCFKSAGSRGI